MAKAYPVTLNQVFRLWLPLAGSWVLMSIESPMLTAFVARMVSPEITLAAWGSLVYPISLAIEGPIIMLLTASTALAADRKAYDKLFKYMCFMSVILTLIHVILAFTPLYYFLAEGLMGIPEPLLEPGRIGLQIMTPWTIMIAWRRLNQGLMIKFGDSKSVAMGTVVRLVSLVSVLSIGKWFTSFSGIFVGSSAVAICVTMEALYAHIVVQKILRNKLPESSKQDEITRKSFTKFYLPLAIAPLTTLLVHPFGAAGMSRMPEALSSLAAWPVVYGLVFLTRSLGMAFNEVVVALVGKPNGKKELFRFTQILSLSAVAFLGIIAYTPLGEIWFRNVSGLSPSLTNLASVTIMFAVLMPGYQVYQAWYAGTLVHHNQTKGISESVMIYAGLALLGLWIGTQISTFSGIYWAINVFVFSGVCQTFFLRYRYKRISI